MRSSPPVFVVPYKTFAFPANTVTSPGELRFTPDDLAHALFTTGRAPGDRAAHGAASVYEWLHRTSLIPAYIRRNFDGELIRSDLALELDRSEKVAVSYALGQAMTAIFCRNLLFVSHLLHVDRYASHYKLRFGETRQRSDLFGSASNGWVVAEAKGRSGVASHDLRQKLEQQKRSVALIGGARPWLAVGCVASFPRRKRAMRLDSYDPDKDGVESVEFTVTRDRFILAYYLPFLRAVEVGGQESDDVFISGSFESFGLRVRLPRLLADRLRAAEQGDVEGLDEDVRALLDAVTSRAPGVFSDGTVVETNWRDALELAD
ncbi:hypothetical protein ACIBCH_24145 [Amycolatopsis thailandensis]|uniref:hypothetical protein n=1 Tax=Amycolatopsis thailandensis TaxID=589330 RepID=UPI0037B94841